MSESSVELIATVGAVPGLSIRGCRWHHESARHSTGCDRCGVSVAATYQRGEENVDCRSGRES